MLTGQEIVEIVKVVSNTIGGIALLVCIYKFFK